MAEEIILQALLTAISEKLGREVTVSVNKAAIVTTDVDLSTSTEMQGEFNIEEDCVFLFHHTFTLELHMSYFMY